MYIYIFNSIVILLFGLCVNYIEYYDSWFLSYQWELIISGVANIMYAVRFPGTYGILYCIIWYPI